MIDLIHAGVDRGTKKPHRQLAELLKIPTKRIKIWLVQEEELKAVPENQRHLSRFKPDGIQTEQQDDAVCSAHPRVPASDSWNRILFGPVASSTFCCCLFPLHLLVLLMVLFQDFQQQETTIKFHSSDSGDGSSSSEDDSYHNDEVLNIKNVKNITGAQKVTPSQPTRPVPLGSTFFSFHTTSSCFSFSLFLHLGFTQKLLENMFFRFCLLVFRF